MIKRPQKKKPQKKLEFAGLQKLAQRKTGIHITTPQFRHFDATQKNSALKIYMTIRKNQKKLENGETLICKLTGAKVKKEFTGSYGGRNNSATYSVELKRRKFFIKFTTPAKIWANHFGFEDALRILNQNFKQGRIKVQLLTPHLMHTNEKHNRGILVTDYFNPKEVIQLIDIKDSKIKSPKSEIEKTFLRLVKTLRANGVQDVSPANAFYHFKTKTILLFDIETY